MRMMLKVVIPVEKGNQAIRDGSLPKVIESFMQSYKPEAAYFVAEDGMRCAIFFFDLPDPTHIPSVAEIFFLGLDAELTCTPAMNVSDLKIGVEKMMKSIS